MRQVFSSPRIENAEAVATLLREGGVEVRVSNGRGWRGAIRGNFSYREQAARGPQPEVWVLRSEDYPKARQLLRDAGLPQGGPAGGAYLGPSVHASTTGERAAATRRPGSRARTGALLTVALAVGAGYFLVRWAASNAPPRAAPVAAAPAAGPSLIADAPAVHAIPVPPALAATLLSTPALSLPRPPACVAVDGQDPVDAVFASAPAGRWQRQSACDDGLPRVAIGPYRTDGSGSGTVQVAVASAAQASTRVFAVERNRDDWRVLGQAPPEG